MTYDELLKTVKRAWDSYWNSIEPYDKKLRKIDLELRSKYDAEQKNIRNKWEASCPQELTRTNRYAWIDKHSAEDRYALTNKLSYYFKSTEYKSLPEYVEYKAIHDEAWQRHRDKIKMAVEKYMAYIKENNIPYGR